MLLCKAFARYLAPAGPIALWRRFKNQSTLTERRSEIDVVSRKRFTVLLRNASARCSAPVAVMLLLRRKSLSNAFEKERTQTIEESEIVKEDNLLDDGAVHRQEAGCLHLLSRCLRDQAWIVSVERNMILQIISKEKTRFTVLFFNPLAICSAPNIPTRLF